MQSGYSPTWNTQHPFVPTNFITRLCGIPLMPPFAVLLKLQVHRDSEREGWQERERYQGTSRDCCWRVSRPDHRSSALGTVQIRVDEFVEELPGTIYDIWSGQVLEDGSFVTCRCFLGTVILEDCLAIISLHILATVSNYLFRCVWLVHFRILLFVSPL